MPPLEAVRATQATHDIAERALLATADHVHEDIDQKTLLLVTRTATTEECVPLKKNHAPSSVGQQRSGSHSTDASTYDDDICILFHSSLLLRRDTAGILHKI
jgi:hypothetical protein